MTNPLTVVVHGATGSQGLPIVQALLERGHSVRGLARHAELLQERSPGAEPVVADLSDRDALRRAYDGADAVVAQMPIAFGPGIAEAHAEAIAAAVAGSGVGRVVFSTGGPYPPEPIGVPYVDARVRLGAALRATSARAVAVGPAAGYAENLALPASARRVLEGWLGYPLPEAAPVPWLATADLGALVADLVATDEEGSLVLVGPEALTGDGAAAAVGSAVGREVRWETISPVAYEEQLRPVIGPEDAAGIAGMYAAGADAPPPPPPAPETVRVGATTLAAWAAAQDWERLAASTATPA